MMNLREDWRQLTPDQKFEARFAALMSPANLTFATPEAERTWKANVQRIKDAIELKKPDRVPVVANAGFYPAKYAGITAEEAMYDYGKLGMAWKKFNRDFHSDTIVSSFIIGPGKLFELLDYKLYRWPGHGTPPDTPYQCIEEEYMKADEYDQLIADPSGYFMRTYLPRVFGALGPWGMLPPFTDIVELPFVGATMIPFGIPPVRESWEKILQAGQLAMEWIGAVGAIDGEIMATMGRPPIMGGFAKAPFDTLGDTLRGTRPIMLDIYRRPGQLLEAMERLVPLGIEMGVRAATTNANPFVFIPLHKGADGFLSRENFAKFYWPTLKAVMLGLINEGLVPFVFVEGSYNQRLDFLADPDLPKGRIYWLFDKTDMVEVKKHLGGKACFGGNVPVTLLKAGTKDQVRDYVKKLIDDVAGDGGYILSAGGVVDEAVDENYRTFVETGLEYGVYR